MKFTVQRFSQFLRKPQSEISGALFFGPDRGLIQEQAQNLIKAWKIPREDPFSISVLSESELKTNPARFADEMSAMSLTATDRLVRVTEAGEVTARILKEYFTSLPNRMPSDSRQERSENLKQASYPLTRLLVEGADLSPRSALRRFFETESDLFALGCYHDNPGTLLALINEACRKKGYSLTESARSALLPCLEGDRRQARSEFEKLTLYVGEPGIITHEDVLAVCTVSAEINLQAFLFNVTRGQVEDTEKQIEALIQAKTSPISLIRALQNHISRLLKTARGLKHGEKEETLLKALKPPVFIFHKSLFLQQVRHWSVGGLEKALRDCLTAETQIKHHSGLEIPVLKRLILSLSLKSRKQGAR